MPHMVMVHDKDPKDVIWEKVGDIGEIQVKYRNILLATYVRPPETKGGIIIPERYRDEDIYQGKAHLVLAMGPDAFASPEGEWDDINGVQEGDWVIIRAGDGWGLNVNGQDCKMCIDASIRMKIPHPDTVW